MDLPSQEVEIPMPLNTAYGGALLHGHVTNLIHHHHHHQHQHEHEHEHDDNAHEHPPSPPSQFQAPTTNDHHHHLLPVTKKHQQQVRYRECLKNHAASMGGSATDGCGEFMPSGEEGSIESLTCSACNCHRNFHRKEVEGELSSFPIPQMMYGSSQQQQQQQQHQHLMINSTGRKVINLGHHKNMLYTGNGGGGPRPVPMIPYSMGSLMISSDQSDDQEELGGAGAAAAAPSGGVACRALPPPPPAHQQNQYYLHHHNHNQMAKKRFRTKFTPEQKEKMLSFAEKVGWKIQKQGESVVNEFCQEIGVKRRVLKVWMHNNKHSLAKKSSDISNA